MEVVQLITGGLYPATARPGGERPPHPDLRSFGVEVFGFGPGFRVEGFRVLDLIRVEGFKVLGLITVEGFRV